MGQSLVQNYIHIVFSTKYRQKLIFPPFEEELYQYIGGTCNELGCQSIIVGGHQDHVHILCMLAKDIRLMELLKKIKASSSKWMKTKDPSLSKFYWQDGYGAFSVKGSEIKIVKNYISNQHAHHSKKSFKKEYINFLKEYEVEYNENYLWD